MRREIMSVTGLKLSFLTLVAAALAMTSAASGSTINASDPGVVFTLGNIPQPGEENVLLNTGTTGNTVFGQTNQTHVLVQFTSPQTLSEPSSGQARVEAINGGGSQVGLTDITISVPGHTYGDLIFNPDIAGNIGVPGGTLNVSVTDIHGMVFLFSYALGHGENFLTITTTGGDTIVSTTLQYSLPGGFTDLRQTRISGVTVIPEPATYVPCMGLGLGLIALLRRRRGVSDNQFPRSELV